MAAKLILVFAIASVLITSKHIKVKHSMFLNPHSKVNLGTWHGTAHPFLSTAFACNSPNNVSY